MKKKAAPLLAVVVLVVVVAAIVCITNLVKKYTPTSEVMDGKEYFSLSSDDEAAIVIGRDVSSYKGMVSGDVCYVDFEAVKEQLNDRFYWDSEANLMLYTTPTDIIEIPAGGQKYTATGKTETVSYDIVKVDGTKTYLALDFVQMYTNLEYELFHDPERIVITNEWGEKTLATIRKNGKLRYQGGIKSPILRELQKNEVVTVLEPM